MNDIMSKVPLKYWNLVSLSILIVGLAGGYLVIDPLYKKVKLANDEYLNNLSKGKEEKAHYEKLLSLQKEYPIEKLDGYSKKLDTVLPADEKAEDIAVQLQEIVKKAGFKDPTFDWRPLGETGPKTFIFEGEVKGDQKALGNFIEMVGNNRRLLEITSLALTTDGSGTPVAKWTIEARGYSNGQ